MKHKFARGFFVGTLMTLGAIAGSVFTGLSDPGRCQQEHIFSAGCYSGRGDMVGHTDIAFMDKIS